MAVYGIDLGTTHSCIARVDDVGRPTVLRNMEGIDTTPSVVCFESGDNIIVGAAARDTAVLDPDLVVSLVKRDMGHDVPRELHGRTHTPEEVSAFILRKLAADATATTGEEVSDVVITVPAYFGVAERDATRKAGEIAGLHVIDIISEPIAAAITYGVLHPPTDGRDRTVLVYDLGGGTFDTTVITLRDGDIHVVCTDGDHELGGADWDARLVEHLAERFAAEHPEAGRPLDDKHTEQQLRRDAEEAKKVLSARARHTVRVMHGGRVATVELTRQSLEELTKDLLDRTIEITGRTLATAAERGVTDYDDLVLVGGATKIPAVPRRLASELSLNPIMADPDLAVAKGAAVYAFEETYRRLLAAGGSDEAGRMAAEVGLSELDRRRITDRQITTVASRAFGVLAFDPETGSEHVVHLVHANDGLPCDARRGFGTVDDGQTLVHLVVVEQAGSTESVEVADNVRVADGELQISSGRPAGWPIDVAFSLDLSGLLHVSAMEKETGEQLRLDVRIGEMSEEQVDRSRIALARVRVD